MGFEGGGCPCLSVLVCMSVFSNTADRKAPGNKFATGKEQNNYCLYLHIVGLLYLHQRNTSSCIAKQSRQSLNQLQERVQISHKSSLNKPTFIITVHHSKAHINFISSQHQFLSTSMTLQRQASQNLINDNNNNRTETK